VKSAQIFPSELTKTVALERFKTIVMSASGSAFKAFKKHVVPQLKLLEPSFRFHVRKPPVEMAVYTREFFGLAVDKYYYNTCNLHRISTFENLFTSLSRSRKTHV
jgi:hypothetical protein